MPEFFVTVSEHDAHRECIPFAPQALARYTPGRFQSSTTFGPYTQRGAERVAQRALSQVADDVTTAPSGARWARDQHGVRVVKVFALPEGAMPAYGAIRYMPSDSAVPTGS